jgi:hypothetical protein
MKGGIYLIRFIKSFTTAGKILMVVNCISVIAAFILNRYDGLPFAFIAIICVVISFRDTSQSPRRHKYSAAEEFKQNILEKSDKEYGLCPPPIEAQEGLNVLIEHFLGKDWYTVMPVSQKQVNTEAIYQILQKYPKKCK